MTSRSLTVRLLHGVREDTLPRLCGQCQGEGLLGFPLTWIPAGSYNSLNDRAFFDSRGPGSMSEFTHFNESDRKSTRLNSSHLVISYAVFCLKKKKKKQYKYFSELNSYVFSLR